MAMGAKVTGLQSRHEPDGRHMPRGVNKPKHVKRRSLRKMRRR